jgi:hypothetical protein
VQSVVVLFISGVPLPYIGGKSNKYCFSPTSMLVGITQKHSCMPFFPGLAMTKHIHIISGKEVSMYVGLAGVMYI